MSKNIFTADLLQSMGFTQQPDGSFSKPSQPHDKPKPVPAPDHSSHPPRLHNPKPQQPHQQTLDHRPQTQTSRTGRVKVCIVRHATRPLDPDNLAGGCKPLIDALRYANLIPDDDPESITLQTSQQKCPHAKERTEIILQYSK